MNDLLLSILIPVYNAGEHLFRCLESIISQNTNKIDIEIIIINDGSKDNSLTIINSFSKKDNRIKVISRENKGIGFTRNELLEKAKGQYIWFIDADDYIMRNSFHTLLPILVNNTYDMLLLSYVGYFGNTTIPKSYSGVYSSGIELTKNKLYNNSLWSRIFRRNLFLNNSVHFHNISMGEDFDIVFRLTPFIGKVKCISEPMYAYVANNQSAIGNKDITHRQKTANDSLKCIYYCFDYLKKLPCEEQRIMRIPFNDFVRGYLYSITFGHFSNTYIKQIYQELFTSKILPLKPLPSGWKRKLFVFAINNKIALWVLVFKQRLLSK